MNGVQVFSQFITNIGFTGSRQGMSAAQSEVFADLLFLLGPRHFHHGCCIGADEQAHTLSKSIPGLTRHLHRPLDESQMAVGLVGVDWPPAPYLKRNRTIVRSSGLLIAAPSTHEALRSGTWSTVRYARRLGRPIVLVWASGALSCERFVMTPQSLFQRG
jgi:hypothetical protein